MNSRILSRIVASLMVLTGLESDLTWSAEQNPAPRYSREFDACMDKAGGETAASRDCTGDELKKQDQRLNAAYGVLTKSADEDVVHKLKAAQRSWIQFRDSQCELSGAVAGGTLAALVVDSCHLKFTEQRAGELEKLSGQIEGGQ